MSIFLSDPEQYALELEGLLPSQFHDCAWCQHGITTTDRSVILGGGGLKRPANRKTVSTADLRIFQVLGQQGYGAVLDRPADGCPEFAFFDSSVQRLIVLPIGISYSPYSALLLPIEISEETVWSEVLYDDFVHDAGLVLLNRWMKHRSAYFTTDRLKEVESTEDLLRMYLDYVAYWIRPESIQIDSGDDEFQQPMTYAPPFTVHDTYPLEVPLKVGATSYICTFKLPLLKNLHKINSPRRMHRLNILASCIAGDFSLLAGFHQEIHAQRSQVKQFSIKFNDIQKILDREEVASSNLATQASLVPEPASPPPPPSIGGNCFYWSPENGWTVVFNGHLIDIENASRDLYKAPGLTHIWHLIKFAVSIAPKKENLRSYYLLRLAQEPENPAKGRKRSGFKRRQKFLDIPSQQHKLMSANAKKEKVVAEAVDRWNIYKHEWLKLSTSVSEEETRRLMALLQSENTLIKAAKFQDPRQMAIQYKWDEIKKEFKGIFGTKYEEKGVRLELDSEGEYYIERNRCEDSVATNIDNVIKKFESLAADNPGAIALATYLRKTMVIKQGDNPFEYRHELADPDGKNIIRWTVDPPPTE